jgi:hypothetical protein
MKIPKKIPMKISYEKSQNRETDRFQPAIAQQTTHQLCVANYTSRFSNAYNTY